MKRYLLLITAMFLLIACTSEIDQSLNGHRAERVKQETLFYATIEDSSNPDTKVYADDQMRVLWNADDRITIFNKETYGKQYRFTGNDGANAGGFKVVDSDDEFTMSNPLDYVYAVYPYAPENDINYDGILTLDLPAEQTYKENSFGMGANTMVSVSSGTSLKFRNVGGYLSFKLYGEGVFVKSITLKGNNNEKLAGKAKITMPVDGLPTAVMQNTATDAITLSCETPVALGATEEDYTEFWFVVPPTTFTGGFTVTVTDALGGTFEMKTTKERVIERNTLTRMSPVEVVPSYDFVPFKDANFKAYCVENFDTDHDNKISKDEALAVTTMSFYTNDIASLYGISCFKNLQSLTCRPYYAYHEGNGLLYDDQDQVVTGLLTDLDLSHNTELVTLICYGNLLTNLNVSGCRKLTRIDAWYNKLTSLDISKNTALARIDCDFNQLTSLDVSKNTALTYLSCPNNQLAVIDISNNLKLERLYCANNPLTQLDVSKNTALTNLSCGNTLISNLDISKNTALTFLSCADCQLTSLDVSKHTALKSLSCGGNLFTSLNVTNNTAMTTLSCYRLHLSSLDISKNTALVTMNCSDNELTQLDVSKCTALTRLWCPQNQLTTLDVSQNPSLSYLSCVENQLTSLDVSNNSVLSNLFCTGNAAGMVIWIRPGQVFSQFMHDNSAVIQEKGEPIPQGNIAFEDANFKSYCVMTADLNDDGEVSYAEALLVTGTFACIDWSIQSMAGIEHFVHLQSLYCYNNQIASLDLSHNSELIRLYCYNNPLTSLNVSGCTKLQILQAYETQLAALDVRTCTELTTLNVQNCPIISFQMACPKMESLNLNNIRIEFGDLPDLSQLPLKYLHLSTVAHQMPSGFLRNFPDLIEVNFCGFQGTTIDLSLNKHLQKIWCEDMVNITTLDLSYISGLKELYLSRCAKLTTVYLATGTELKYLKKDEHTSIVYK